MLSYCLKCKKKKKKKTLKAEIQKFQKPTVKQ